MSFRLYRYSFLAALLCISSQAGAGIFSDDEARSHIQQIESRLNQLDELLARDDINNKKQARTLLDLQSQIESQNTEIRALRGLNEELSHNLQDIEKRQRDINVDLDARLRKQETQERASLNKPETTDDTSALENSAFDAAFGFYKTERYPNAVTAFQDFLNKFPQSTHTADIYYMLGFSQYVLKNYKGGLTTYKKLVTLFPNHPKLAAVLLNTADCQIELKDKTAAKLTLKLIVSKFPNSDAAKDAKKQLAQLK